MTLSHAHPATLIDTHCHLDAAEFEHDRDAVVQAAMAVGVSHIVVPAVERKNFSVVRDCCQRYPIALPAYGIHPLYVNHADESDVEVLREFIAAQLNSAKAPVAVGEIGLDYFVSDANPQRQEYFYHAQLKLARDFNLPVILHVRRAVDQVLKGLRRFKVCGGIAHAFNGSMQQAEAFIQLGFKLGFGGAMTYSGSTRLHALAANLPLESIVIETDAPDIPPTWLAGQRNAPAELLRIVKVLAELRNLPVDTVIATTTANAKTVLNLPC